MSARVFNPAVMSELRKGLLGSDEGHSVSRGGVAAGASLQRVKRDLFGPVDHADIEEMVRRELGAQHARDADRWGFDFERGSPRRNGPGTSRWVWKKVLPGEEVALSYLNTVAAGSCEPAPATTSANHTAPTPSPDPALAADNNNKQAHITDYMKAKKRSYNSDSKAAAVTSEQPPPKQAKTNS